MLAGARLKELEEARRLVVLRSDLHRRMLALEGAALRERLGGLGAARGTVAATRGLFVLAALAGGLAAARRGRASAGWWPVVLAAWRWWRNSKRPRPAG